MRGYQQTPQQLKEDQKMQEHQVKAERNYQQQKIHEHDAAYKEAIQQTPFK
jgi:hypothetical protein